MSELATDRAWHGPASVVGVMVGLVVEAVPLLVRSAGASWLLFLLPPVLGVLLLAGGTRVRQLGLGLLASGLAYPFAIAAYALSALAG